MHGGKSFKNHFPGDANVWPEAEVCPKEGYRKMKASTLDSAYSVSLRAQSLRISFS